MNHELPSILGRPIDGAQLTAAAACGAERLPSPSAISGCAARPAVRADRRRDGATIVSSSDVSYRLSVLVTASNSAGAATAESDATGIVSPAPPANVMPPTIMGDPYLGVELSVDEGQWSGTEPCHAYRWQRCRQGSCVDVGERNRPTR